MSPSEVRFDGAKSEPSFSFQPVMRLMSCANRPVRRSLEGASGMYGDGAEGMKTSKPKPAVASSYVTAVERSVLRAAHAGRRAHRSNSW